MTSSEEVSEDSCRMIIGLSLSQAQPDAAKLLEMARADGFDFVTTKISDSQEPRDDVINLQSQWWHGCVVGQVDSIDNSTLNGGNLEEFGKRFFDGLSWAHHMNLPAVILPPIPPNLFHEYAGALSNKIVQTQSHSFQFWIPVSMNSERLRDFDVLHRMCDGNYHLAAVLVLEPLPANLEGINPEDYVASQLRTLHLALGQTPVKAVLLSTNIFLRNKRGYPTLAKSHQLLFTELLKRIGRTVRVLLQGPANHKDMLPGEHLGRTECLPYLQYIQHLRKRPEIMEALDSPEAKLEIDYLDALQVPLQPLKDHLEFATYETFEKDPVKYEEYRKAISLAISHLSAPGTASKNDAINVFVVGAGRGPLVTCALKAFEEAGSIRDITVIAVEKNPSAMVYLHSLLQRDPLWKKYKVQVVASDLRSLTPELCGNKTADIVVSELLGSFGDNELSPECLDAFYLTAVARDDTISIPMRYTAYLAPISSAKLHNQARSQALYPNQDESNVHGLQKAMETPYVVRTHASCQTHPEQTCWSFVHPTPNPDKSRSSILDFEPHASSGCGFGSGYGRRNSATEASAAPADTACFSSPWTLAGLLGTFSADLYATGDGSQLCQISNSPSTFSVGMFSWFPLYFPLKDPVHVPANATVRVFLWRRVDTDLQKVWYEWSVMVRRNDEILSVTPIHNPGGRSYFVSMN